MPEQREQWSSRIGFILATVGSAVGLGNVWRFPTMVARSGGGAFLLLYLVVVVAVGVPIMMSELAMGRRSQRGLTGAFRNLGPGGKWWPAGLLPALAAFLILSYYSVIAGWTLIYTVYGISGNLGGLDAIDLLGAFTWMTESTFLPILGQAVFLLMSSAVVYYGVAAGIERWSKILMPTITFLLLLLLVRVLSIEGAIDGVLWFLRPDFGLITFNTALEAVGQVFFSFSLGMGAVLTYGSYLSPDDDITRNSFIISIADVGIAVLAGLVVISALFAFNIEPEIGFGLVFVALPAIFNTFPLAQFWVAIFFLALSFAALTSMISFLEVVNAILMEELNWTRPKSVVVLGILIFIAGVPSALSTGTMRELTLFGRDIMDAVDALSSNLLLPLSGLITAIFVGWIWGARSAADEIRVGAGDFRLAPLWSFIVRYVVPVALLYILIAGLLP